LLGCAAAWIGLVVPSLHFLYDYSWFVGFGVAFVAYWLAEMGSRTYAAEADASG
jgi:NCS1 family nucleobase:cation symporter-1